MLGGTFSEQNLKKIRKLSQEIRKAVVVSKIRTLKKSLLHDFKNCNDLISHFLRKKKTSFTKRLNFNQSWLTFYWKTSRIPLFPISKISQLSLNKVRCLKKCCKKIVSTISVKELKKIAKN